ncbi:MULTISPECIES: transferase [unclassified Streptomyces]|uniref:transferase n=1 Tax=unclassified Streptomyces TaxID=2593676 RepID=UPI0007C57FEB|nr:MULTISPECIES: transferase [unclassified Streptomyces]
MTTTPHLRLGSYLTNPTHSALADTPYARLAAGDLAEWLTAWPDLHAQALKTIPHRIHPSARIHPTAIIGDDVIIGAGARVWEFSTVRGHTLLAPGARVGFNCEITNTYLGAGTVLGHRIGLNRTLVGDQAHLSADVMAAAIHLTADMTRPGRDTFLRLPDGIYPCRTPRFGALIGDRVQTGSRFTLGPGTAIGRACHIHSHTVIGPTTVIPDHHTITPTDRPTHHARPRRG